MCRQGCSGETVYRPDMKDPKENTELLCPFQSCVAHKDAFVELLSHVPWIDHLSVLRSEAW